MNYRVLLIEGAGKHWDGIEKFLRKKGHEVKRAPDLKAALAVVRHEPINIILSELDIPKVNSTNLVKKLKSENPSLEIIFLTSKVSLHKAIEALKVGAYDIYEVPINHKFLQAVMEKAGEKQTLYFEKSELERKVIEKFNFGNIIGRSKPMSNLISVLSSIAPKKVNVLITGETGTGKEMVANAIHYNSPRASRPIIKVNCASLGEGVLESELFGHEKGAFTGAYSKRIGRFELANGGTIFLDEVGDIPPGTQVKLLRVLQEKEFERVGGNETIKVDVRVIAATNMDLKQMIARRQFREDLYYRLNVVQLDMPPIRDRKEDIPLLVSYFIQKLNEEKDFAIKGITKEAMKMIINYAWPGNVRELENAIESAMAIAPGDMIDAKYLPSMLFMQPMEQNGFITLEPGKTLAEMEADILKDALQRVGGNKSKAARMLGIGLRTLQRKLK